jgi:hypothetical protein
MKEARAQTAASFGLTREVNWSTVKVSMPTGFALSPNGKGATSVDFMSGKFITLFGSMKLTAAG